MSLYFFDTQYTLYFRIYKINIGISRDIAHIELSNIYIQCYQQKPWVWVLYDVLFSLCTTPLWYSYRRAAAVLTYGRYNSGPSGGDLHGSALPDLWQGRWRQHRLQGRHCHYSCFYVPLCQQFQVDIVIAANSMFHFVCIYMLISVIIYLSVCP